MSTARVRGPITLSGPPRNTFAVVSFDAVAGVVPLTIELADGPALFRAQLRPFGSGRSEMRLRLPADTPPGTYKGEVAVDGRALPIAVEVDGVLRILVQPRELFVKAGAGDRVDFRTAIVNRGNVPFDVPKDGVFELDDAAGQDRALGRALRADLPTSERRVDRFFEELRAEHAGQARVAVTAGAGRIEPGATVDIAATLELPPTAVSGRSYLGFWSLGNAGLVFSVEITKGGSPSIGRRQT